MSIGCQNTSCGKYEIKRNFAFTIIINLEK